MPLSIEQFGDRMIKLVPQLKAQLCRYENNLLHKKDITVAQLIVLEGLSHCDFCTMHKLAEVLKVQFSAATMIIDRLVKTGYVVRERGEEDRRTVFVRLTPKGKKILQEVYQQRRKGIIHLFSRLSAKEREEYLNILEKLVERFSCPDAGCKF